VGRCGREAGGPWFTVTRSGELRVVALTRYMHYSKAAKGPHSVELVVNGRGGLGFLPVTRLGG